MKPLRRMLDSCGTATSAGLEARADLVEGKLDDGGSCVAHLRAAAKTIRKLQAQVKANRQEVIRSDSQYYEACARHETCLTVLETSATAQEVMACCLAYGGGSFPEPTRRAIEHYATIKAAVIRARLKP